MNLASFESEFAAPDITAMSPITQKLDAMLAAESFVAVKRMRSKGHNVDVNDLWYLSGESERVFVITHEKEELKHGQAS